MLFWGLVWRQRLLLVENTLFLGDEDWVGVDGLGYLRLGYEAFIRSIGIFYVSLQEQ